MADKKLLCKVLLAVFLLTTAFSERAFAGDWEKDGPGAFILDHIGDAYEWHILSVNEHHVSVPLPVILYSRQSGLNVFMSSKFYHGKKEHAGFKIAKDDGPNKGKIVEVATGERPMLDLSITKNVFALFVSIAIILWVFLSVAKAYAVNGSKKAPKGLQSFMEPIILYVRDDIARPVIGHKYKQFMPYLLTAFFFILINNLIGLIPFFPFGANVTGNIAVTLVLAMCTFFIVIFNSNKMYWAHIVNTPGVPWWLKMPIPLMPFIELIGVFTKPFALMIRLFANITGGHIILLSLACLIFIFGEMSVGLGYGVSVVSVLFSVFMLVLKILVAFIQANVFTLLSAIYFEMATAEHH